MNEEWRRVPGFEFLEVTSTARVRKAAETKVHGTRWGKSFTFAYRARELSPRVYETGYYRFNVLRNGVRTNYYLHRMVALAFVPGYTDGLQVNHKNGIKTDNRPENLEWVSRAMNVRLAWEDGFTGGRYYRFRDKKRAAQT